MKIAIQLGLAIVAVVLAYFIYTGIQDKIIFQEKAEDRREVVQERLTHIVTAQKTFRGERGRYAANFNELLDFLNNDSLTIIKAIGNVPDTLTEAQAVERGIVIRDTALVPANTIFNAGFPIDSLRIIPFSNGNEFKMKAGVIEKNKVNVNVFEASAKLEDVYNGLNTKNENIDLNDVLKVGSMTEPITTGNW
ncbi:MAG: hypothetical protein DWP98_14005 [Bacteroidetes bacterium]|nr:MAG: hypothetical protein DWP98_14005 [Bacteroidota bacterium]MBL1144189.1 hypothetical protein [Bacteroidota bacterium]MCB0803537.1 hypothetical protein [Flavobacteriales bacterium]NOG56985.1 hypothetical protein [Bacteroidota bacterium]